MVILTACAALALYIGFSDRFELPQPAGLAGFALRGFRLDLEKRAVSLGYFFSEREYDLRSMAGSREINAYFGNKALGMSEEYGLKLTYVRRRAAFSKNAAGKGDPGRSHLRAVSCCGTKAARSWWTACPARRGAAVAAKGDRDGFETREPGGAFASDETQEDRKSCFSISSPVYSKGIEVGELEARINPWTPWVHFVENQSFLSIKASS